MLFTHSVASQLFGGSVTLMQNRVSLVVGCHLARGAMLTNVARRPLAAARRSAWSGLLTQALIKTLFVLPAAFFH